MMGQSKDKKKDAIVEGPFCVAVPELNVGGVIRSACKGKVLSDAQVMNLRKLKQKGGGDMLDALLDKKVLMPKSDFDKSAKSND